MNNRRARMFFLCLLVAMAFSGWGAEAPDSSRNEIDARAELSSYFAKLDEKSPVFGSIAGSPEVKRQISHRIATMNDVELEELRNAMTEMPDWQNAPQMLAEMLPQEMRDHLLKAGDYYVGKSEEALAARDELSTLVALTKVLPPEEIARLGIDVEAIQNLDETFRSMSPLEVTMLQEKLEAAPEWTNRRKRALEALPEAVRKGSAALALHGELTEGDVASLESFRKELTGLLERIEALPPTLRSRLDVERVRTLVDRLEFADPEMLFMIRDQISADQIETIETSVELLERLAGMTEEEYTELERFREELRISLENRVSSSAKQQIEELTPEQLMLLHDSLGANPEWKDVMPTVADAFDDPATEASIRNARNRAAELEAFRTNAIAFVHASIGQPGVGQEQAARATSVLQGASLEHLALIEAAHARMPESASAAAMVALPPVTANAVDLNCVVSLGSITIPVIDEEVSLGSIDFNWICSPIETAINAVTNTVNSIVSAITDTVNSIWSFIQTIPDLAVNALKSAFNELLDIEIANGVSLLDIATSENVGDALDQMITLMGLRDFGWLNDLSAALGTMPMLPCPERGIMTPFGEVGDWDAYMSHQRYQFVVEELLEIIPETEISLAIKIPAQLLFMGFKYLGLCLEYGTEAATWDHYEAYWDTSRTNQSGISTQITTTGSSLSGQLASSTSSLTGTVNTEGSSTRTQLGTESQIIQDKIDALQLDMGDRFADQGNNMDEQFQDAWNLELRLAIETNLKAGEGNELAVFQMPAPQGYLDVVRDVLRSSIDGMVAIGETIGLAEKYFAAGDALMNEGKFKAAFKEFQKSYAALVK